MRVSASHNRDEIFARRFFLVLSHFDLTLSQHRGILFFFLLFMGSGRMYIAGWKMSGVTGPRKLHSLRLRTFLRLFPLSIDATEINAYWD